MNQKLAELEHQIELSRNESLEKRKAILEPLFNEIYRDVRKSENTDLMTLLKLSQLENQVTNRMIEVLPKVEPSLEKKTEDQIAYYVRKKYMEKYPCNIQTDSLRSRSHDFSAIALEIIKNLGFPACIFDIGEIFSFPFSHEVVIAYTDDFYLFDFTYQQFFLLGYNFQERYYEHPSYPRKREIGSYMVGDFKESAARLIENGYLKVCSQDFKNYADGCSFFGEIDTEDSALAYLKKIMKVIERSCDKSDRILLSKMSNL